MLIVCRMSALDFATGWADRVAVDRAGLQAVRKAALPYRSALSIHSRRARLSAKPTAAP